MEKLLTPGAITQILENKQPASPVLQIIGYKPMTSDQTAYGDSTDELRYRLMIGDGIRAHQYCVITNQDLVDDIKNGRLEKWSIIKVTSYRTVDCGDGPPEMKRRLIYILNLEVVRRGSEVGCKLSCQQPLDNFTNNTPMQPMQPPKQPQQTLMGNMYASDRQPMNGSAMDSTQPQPYPIGGMQQETIRSPRNMRAAHDNQTIGIGELTPYIGKWVVKGRVTSKSGIREYNNAKGGGKLFSFTMADKTGEIKVTAFNADCERVYPYVEANKVYVLGRASVKNADKRYTTADFEITLNSDSLLEEVTDSQAARDIPLAKFNFVSIASLASIPPNQPVDLIGAITSVSESSTIISKTRNKELKKRNIVIVDMSRHSIGVTIWGEQADTFNGAVGDIFVTKAARVGTYGGRSASSGDCLFINPDTPEVRKIRNWYSNLLDSNFTCLTTTQDAVSGGDQYKYLMEMLDIEQARAASSGPTSGIYARCKAFIMSVGKNPVYKCCTTEGCGKKLVDTQNGELSCQKCQQTFSTFKYRYKTDIEIGDFTSSCWITLWDERAEQVLGMKPEDLERYMKMEKKDLYEKIITRPNFQSYVFTLRARIDTYNQEERVKLHVANMVPLDVASYGRKLMEEIKAMSS